MPSNTRSNLDNKPLVSIVVPVYNNAASLNDLVDVFRTLTTKRNDYQFEYVFVDDLMIDDMLQLWQQGRKVVLAARATRNDAVLTTLLADTFYALFRRFAIKTMPKRGCDFFLIDRQVCDLIKGIQENNAYLMGLILWLGFDPAIIYYRRAEREKRYGKSMWTFAKKLKYFPDSFVAFSYVPVRLASLLGISVSILGGAYALLIIIYRLFFGMQPEGWTSLMVVVLILSGVQLLMIGILGEYLWRNLDETRRRPRFIIDQIMESEDVEQATRIT